MEEKTVVELLFDDDVDFIEEIPLRPVGPCTFILPHRHPNMLTDGWKWKVRGSSKLPQKQPLYRRSLYFYHGQDGVERDFQRQVYERLDDGGRVVIRYIGTPTCCVPAPHGNSSKPGPFVRTNPTVMAKIKEVVQNVGGETVPARLYKQAVRTDESIDPRNCPRDIKQVCNAVQSVRDSMRVANDGILNVARRQLEVDYIHVINMTKDNMSVVVGIPDMIRDFCELFRGRQPTVYYDTTFSMGDFYVSTLLYRHDIFETSPVMPLLMLIHERRTTASHELLFQWLVKLTSMSSVICVADREQSISNALQSVMPQSTMVYCWNHILGDVRTWIRGCGGTAADETFYSASVRDLLLSSNRDKYSETLAELSRRWSQAFVDYYKGSLEVAVVASAVFNTQSMNIANVPFVGVTNNVSESYNRVLKDFQNWKERPLDVVIEGFTHLQQYHAMEVSRGLAGVGTYRLRPGFPCIENMPMRNMLTIQPQDIVQTLQEPSAEVNKPQPAPNVNAEDCMSDAVHAKLLSGRVQLHDGVWLVQDNIRSHDTFMVKLSDGSCSCGFPSCVHVMAVRIAAGLNVTKMRKRANLSVLRRRARAGRKQGRKRGLDTQEQCAPDSVQAKRTVPSTKLSPIQETEVDGVASGTHSPLNKSVCASAEQAVCADNQPLVDHSDRRCRRSLFDIQNSTSEEPADVQPIAWSPAEASTSIPTSPGADCAVTDVVSGKSPGSLIETQGRWLTGSEIDHVQQMLKTQWEGSGLQSTTTHFTEPMQRPFIQVLFSPVRQHWLTVYGAGKLVTVYDSLAGSASQQTQATVRVLAGKRTRVKYSRTCTQQTQAGDCGCFALAYATTLAFGEDPGSYEMVPASVRAHLAYIVRQDIIDKFPYEEHCYCNGPAGGRMVACDRCDRWYHAACLSRVVGSDDWICRRCDV